MKKEHKSVINEILDKLEHFQYWEVLDILNSFSIQLYACAPNDSVQLAINECHSIQKEAITKYLNEKKATKGIVDKAIVDFGEFSREPAQSEVESKQNQEQ